MIEPKTPSDYETHRLLFLRARVELFYLISTILSQYSPEWAPDAALICGLCVMDILGFERMQSTKPEAKREAEILFEDLMPICREVLASGVPFQKPHKRVTIQ